MLVMPGAGAKARPGAGSHMKIASVIGLFFLVLSAIFGFAARGEYLAAQRRWTPAGRTRRRVGLIFGVVGLALTLWPMTWE